MIERNRRWFITQPAPGLGDNESTKEEVDAFYAFWTTEDSWRSFEYLDEEDPDSSSDRENKRYIERKNKAARKKRKNAENMRMLKLIDNCIACDPRVKRFKEQEKQAKNAARLAKEAEAKAAAEVTKASKSHPFMTLQFNLSHIAFTESQGGC